MGLFSRKSSSPQPTTERPTIRPLAPEVYAARADERNRIDAALAEGDTSESGTETGRQS